MGGGNIGFRVHQLLVGRRVGHRDYNDIRRRMGRNILGGGGGMSWTMVEVAARSALLDNGGSEGAWFPSTTAAKVVEFRGPGSDAGGAAVFFLALVGQERASCPTLRQTKHERGWLR